MLKQLCIMIILLTLSITQIVYADEHRKSLGVNNCARYCKNVCRTINPYGSSGSISNIPVCYTNCVSNCMSFERDVLDERLDEKYEDNYDDSDK